MNVLRPAPLDTTIPPIPASLADQPSPVALVDACQDGQWWWAVVRKVTYGVRADGSVTRAEQQPIHTAYARHDPLPEAWGLEPSVNRAMKTVPEARALQAGTDVIVRGHAVAQRPASSLAAGVVLGKFMHRMQVFGKRFAEYLGGRVRFSAPEPFDRIPLRWELAYGGVDKVALQQALALMESKLGAIEWRRAQAFFRDTFAQTVPLAYARNPVGMGYVADADPRTLDGVALPHIELAHDLLTPERFAAGASLQWLKLPIPAGMDYLDLRMFPRSAMMGLPPPGWDCGLPVAEVELGQVPADFCRGNIMTVDDDRAATAIHPDAVRCAPIGLRLPEQRGGEPVNLVGMHAERTRWDFSLPRERPAFTVPGQGRVPARLHQVFIDADAGRMELLWAAPWRAERALQPGEAMERVRQIQTHVEVLP